MSEIMKTADTKHVVVLRSRSVWALAVVQDLLKQESEDLVLRIIFDIFAAAALRYEQRAFMVSARQDGRRRWLNLLDAQQITSFPPMADRCGCGIYEIVIRDEDEEKRFAHVMKYTKSKDASEFFTKGIFFVHMLLQCPLKNERVLMRNPETNEFVPIDKELL